MSSFRDSISEEFRDDLIESGVREATSLERGQVSEALSREGADAASFREALLSAVKSGATDITFRTMDPVYYEARSSQHVLTSRPSPPSLMNMILAETTGSEGAIIQLNALNELDYSYSLNTPDGRRQRFRVNATGIYKPQNPKGMEITFRTLPWITPSLEFAGVSEEMFRACSPRNGIVLITGGTGSGKSTLMAAVVGHHLRSGDPRKFIDIQAPIEFTYEDILRLTGRPPSHIGQSEVGLNVASFANGLRSALRRKPAVICVGECRDLETAATALEAADTGHLIYTTVHASDVSMSVRRMLIFFPAGEREMRGYNLIGSLNMVVNQSIYESPKGGVTVVREMLRFTDRIRRKLLRADMSRWLSMIEEEVRGEVTDTGPDDFRLWGRDHARALFESGDLRPEDAARYGVIT